MTMSAAHGRGGDRWRPDAAAGDERWRDDAAPHGHDVSGRPAPSSGNDSCFGPHRNDPARPRPTPQADPPTQPAGPQALRRELQHLVALATGTGPGFALLYVDVDRFDRVRREVGDDVSNQVLGCVAQRLRSSVHGVGTVTRLDLHGFAVVLPGTESPEDAAHAARTIVAAVGRPIEAAGDFVMLSVSVGVALSGTGGCSIEDLTRAAAAAVACAGRSGGRQVVVGAA